MRKTATGEVDFHDGERATRGCTRIDLDPVPWDVRPERIMWAYMGRHPDRSIQRIAGRPVNWKLPLEEPSDGCPGGWYRCRFVASLIPYLRRRAQDASRVGNPFFDTADDPMIWAWVMYYETEHERALARAEQLRLEHMKRG